MSCAKDTLDKVFSLYIRKRDCRGGVGRCISCGTTITANNCDAGHYISRSNTATRWNSHNVNAQCKVCNQFKNGNIEAYRTGLVNKYGQRALENLERKRHNTVKLSDNDYKTLIRFYREQITRL